MGHCYPDWDSFLLCVCVCVVIVMLVKSDSLHGSKEKIIRESCIQENQSHWGCFPWYPLRWQDGSSSLQVYIVLTDINFHRIEHMHSSPCVCVPNNFFLCSICMMWSACVYRLHKCAPLLCCAKKLQCSCPHLSFYIHTTLHLQPFLFSISAIDYSQS